MAPTDIRLLRVGKGRRTRHHTIQHPDLRRIKATLLQLQQPPVRSWVCYGSGFFTYVVTECGGYAPGGVGKDPGGVEGGAEGDVSGIAEDGVMGVEQERAVSYVQTRPVSS